MRPDLKPLSRQVMVITGATSGHGLCTARMAADEGASVMLAARDEEALGRVCREIAAAGGTADFVVADVSNEGDVERIADRTIERFGGFDTWVNNAGVGVYGDLADLPMEDHRGIFETNYWGTVHGSRVAVRHLRGKPGGGALVNVGSINSDMGSPVLGAYNATKHAIKGFTDSLRIEMLKDKAPVSVTLVKPSAVGTPFPRHGRNETGRRARLPEPLYAPDVTARAILDAAQNRRRSITVGGIGKFQVLGATMLPSLFDRVAVSMSRALVDLDDPVGDKPGNLGRPQGNDGDVEGRQKGRHFSIFTSANRHRGLTIGALTAMAAAGGWALRRKLGRTDRA